LHRPLSEVYYELLQPCAFAAFESILRILRSLLANVTVVFHCIAVCGHTQAEEDGAGRAALSAARDRRVRMQLSGLVAGGHRGTPRQMPCQMQTHAIAGTTE
jgi:hypothetical protein